MSSLENELGHDSWSPADPAPCDNCGDGSGWNYVDMKDVKTGRVKWVWFACADCNDDGLKPKPDVCSTCHRREEVCWCQKEKYDGKHA